MTNLWSGRFDIAPDAAAFDFGASFRFDRRLFEDDVVGSLAWGRALRKAGVLTAAEAHDCVPSSAPASDYFTPSAAEIERLEKALPGWLGTLGGKQGTGMRRVRDRLGGDHLWYFGQIEKGRRVIEIRGFCAQLVEHAEKCYPLVKDGGDCIWYLRYDVATSAFDGFHTNGYA